MKRHWQVLRLKRARDHYYLWHVEVLNHFTGAVVFWNVPNLDNDEYDLSGVPLSALAPRSVHAGTLGAPPRPTLSIP